MPMFEVNLRRSISTTVQVEAENADAALDKASRNDFPLPPRDEWQGHKDWIIQVYGLDGDLLADMES